MTDFRIKDQNGETAIEIMPHGDEKLRSLVRKSQAQASVSNGDIASGTCVRSSDVLKSVIVHSIDDDEDGDAGSGSGSEE